jgi:hypothetical protein
MIDRAPRPDSGFLMIRNDVARDPRLSYRASGVLADILSRPDNWKTSAENLAAARPDGEGVKAVRAALRELESCGYMRRRRVKDDKGRFRWAQTIYDVPVRTESPDSAEVSAGQSTSPFPPDGNRPAEKALLKKTREEDLEEDVTDLSCVDSDRFAHFADGARNDLHDERPESAEAATAAQVNDWRRQDREVFQMYVGDVLVSLGHDWREGQFTADAFYAAFRKKKGRIRWPGRMLENLYAAGGEQGIDDWLLDQGLERAA